MHLRKIELKDKEKIMDLFNEYKNLKSIDKYEGFKNLKYLESMEFEAWLNMLKNNEDKSKIPSNFSISTQYIAVLDDDLIIGGVCLRWEDIPSLLLFGGHIGYSIRPTKRNNGYGNIILKLALEEFKKKNKDKVMVSCKDFNIASKKIIEKNGGTFYESYYDKENDITYLKYWINIV